MTLAGPLVGGKSQRAGDTKYAIGRELGYRVYLVCIGKGIRARVLWRERGKKGGKEGRSGLERREGGRERQRLPLQKKDGQKESKERRERSRPACFSRKREIGGGLSFSLKGTEYPGDR